MGGAIPGIKQWNKKMEGRFTHRNTLSMSAKVRMIRLKQSNQEITQSRPQWKGNKIVNTGFS